MSTWLVLALSVLSLALAALAATGYVRGRRALRRGVPVGPAGVVVAAVERVDPALLRSIVAVLPGAAVRVPCLPADLASPETLAEVHRALPAADLALVPGPVPPRHFARAWLESRGAEATPDAPLLVADARAEPVARTVAAVLGATAHVDLAAACPVASHSGGRGRLAARLYQETVPLLGAACGAPGLPDLLVAFAPAAVGRALADPLSANRRSLAAAAAQECPRSRAVLLPCAVGVAAGRGGTVLREHLATLARSRPAGVAWVLASLAALPAAATLVLAGPVEGRAAALVALAIAWTARAIAALAWTRAVRGLPAALAGIALAPVSDLAGLLALLGAAIPARLRHGGVLFRACKGGTLSPDLAGGE